MLCTLPDACKSVLFADCLEWANSPCTAWPAPSLYVIVPVEAPGCVYLWIPLLCPPPQHDLFLCCFLNLHFAVYSVSHVALLYHLFLRVISKFVHECLFSFVSFVSHIYDSPLQAFSDPLFIYLAFNIFWLMCYSFVYQCCARLNCNLWQNSL